MFEFKILEEFKPNQKIIELVKKLDCIEENDKLIFTNIKNMGFTFFMIY